MATQAQRSESTRASVIEAAAKAFEREGSPSVSLEQIALKAGVTKGAIHYHFGNRTGLLAEVAAWLFERFEKQVAATCSDPTSLSAEAYVRALLTEQAKPVGRLLFSIGDELLREGKLSEADPYPYLCGRLQELGVKGTPDATAAALMHYGRQLAFGQVALAELDKMVESLGL